IYEKIIEIGRRGIAAVAGHVRADGRPRQAAIDPIAARLGPVIEHYAAAGITDKLVVAFGLELLSVPGTGRKLERRALRVGVNCVLNAVTRGNRDCRHSKLLELT